MSCLCSLGCCRGGVGGGRTIISWKFLSLLGVGSLHHSSILPAGAVVVVAWWVVGCLHGFWGYFSFDLVWFFVLSFSITIKVFGRESSSFLDNFVNKKKF